MFSWIPSITGPLLNQNFAPPPCSWVCFHHHHPPCQVRIGVDAVEVVHLVRALSQGGVALAVHVRVEPVHLAGFCWDDFIFRKQVKINFKG